MLCKCGGGPTAWTQSRPEVAGRATQERPSETLRRLGDGYRVSQAIHVAATLGIADLLQGGARTSDDLAAATGSHARSLYRLLRALASVGVFQEDADRLFTLTPVGECLCSDAAESVAGWAAYLGRPYYWQAWGSLLHSVQTGENAFRHVHGMDVWEYRAGHPEEGAIFDRAMMTLTRLSNQALRDAYDFGRFGTVVDVGGGNGAFLTGLLTSYPAMNGVLFDQPHVVAAAHEILEEAGVDDRCRIVGGSFFDAVPEGGDAYVLKAIIHDWEDEEAKRILDNCRRAVGDGVLLIIERDVPSPNEGPAAKFSDLNMLVAPGGQERTIEEYTTLLASSGLALQAVTASASELSVIEAIAR